MRIILAPALALLQAATPLAITPQELDDTEAVARICRSAFDASTDEATAAIDWLAYLHAAALAGGLSVDERRLLVRMCGVYSAAIVDCTVEQRQELQRQLDEMSHKEGRTPE